MELLAVRDVKSPHATGNRFVINLTVPEDGPVQVRSCELIGSHIRNRFSFSSRVSIADVFADPLARAVTGALASLSNKTEVMSLPSVALEIEGLTLAKVHLVTKLSDTGQMDVIVRFKIVLGSISRAFRRDIGIEDSVPDHTAHMSAMVLTDIVMPLLDLCAIAQTDGCTDGAAFDRFMNTLTDRAREVEFQAELIKRFVNSASKPAAQAQCYSTDQPLDRLVNQV